MVFMSLDEIIDDFRENFYSLVQQIPDGNVTTYGALARALGDIRAARAVGKMLNENPRPIEVPCHRVVMSDGSLGGFGMGEEKKIELLEKEGVKVREKEIVDFEDILFEDFESDEPLNELRRYQLKAGDEVRVEDDHSELKKIGGMDVSYSDKEGFVSLSVWEGKEEVYLETKRYDVDFPYIPTYLSFKEMPLLIKMLKGLDSRPDVLLIDGNGIMHPYGIGLASHVGVKVDVPTIGVAKSKLLGDQVNDVTHEEPVSKIHDENRLIGHAFLSSERAKKPIYVSPGHRVSHDTALEVVKMYCRYKVPEPIRMAHIAANRRRKRA